MQTHVSEVAALREQISLEYMAATLGLQGLNAGTSRHAFITAKQERIGELHEQLQELVGEEAMPLVTQTLADVPNAPTRSDILTVLVHELGRSEETEILCDYLQEMWEIIDMLFERFGGDQAQKIILAPSTALRELSPVEKEAYEQRDANP